MKIAVIILAAGLGTRMKSSIPKLLHKICGKSLIQWVAGAVSTLNAQSTIVVVNPVSKGIKDSLSDSRVTFAIQKKPKGTGDALRVGAAALGDFRGTLLVVNGDTPLVEPSTLRDFLEIHKKNKEDLSIVSFFDEGRHSYGRIIRDGHKVKAIIEDRDADAEQKMIQEVNSGIFAMESPCISLLNEIGINEAKGEYYLTDIVNIAVKRELKVDAHHLGSQMDFSGINTREDLHNAGLYLRDRIVNQWMSNGVSFVDRSSVFIHPEVKLGMDTLIYPNVHIEGETIVGQRCTLFPNARIIDSTIGNDVVIKDSTVIESSTVRDRATVGPFAHLRHGSVIGLAARIGNFVETKKSVIGDRTKASHLTYLGDAEIGKDVNIGAGTITCNYDGRKKHKTIVEDNVFVGSDTQLVAPVAVGKGAYIGAGSTITRDVPPFALSVSRARQKNIENWTLKRIKRVQSAENKDKNEEE